MPFNLTLKPLPAGEDSSRNNKPKDDGGAEKERYGVEEKMANIMADRLLLSSTFWIWAVSNFGNRTRSG